jgi:hypothetical protein
MHRGVERVSLKPEEHMRMLQGFARLGFACPVFPLSTAFLSQDPTSPL